MRYILLDNNLNYIHINHKVKKGEEGEEGEHITNIFQIIIWINSD
jgi:hypothetical protein